MPSPIDDLFFQIYGFRPAKEGEAYEIFAAVACKLLAAENQVTHDARTRGLYSKTVYQLDVRETAFDGVRFGEAKDYSSENRKVGRGDIQKLAGALGDLPVKSGKFFSATDYTGPAKKYAAAAAQINGKAIDLFHLRPTAERDLDGRVQSIHIRLHVLMPQYGPNALSPIWTSAGLGRAKAIAGEMGGAIQLELREIYDGAGNVLATVHDLTSLPYGGSTEYPAEGSFVTRGGHLLINGEFIEIHGLGYKIPFHVFTEEVIIKSDGSAVLLLRNDDGTVDKVLRDVDLKKVAFSDLGIQRP